ncbi:MAG: DUF1614 domain-containing protein [Gammaproteobacteria bacterium]|nr:MAG: DUF1614 domain-containing protein [Gammaproteobacteria bacterium]
MPFSPFQFLLFLFLVVFLVAFVQVGLLTLAFDKLGISPMAGLTLLLASLFGSAINLPVARIRADDAWSGPVPPRLRGLLRGPMAPFTGQTVIAVNVGGCIIPVLFSLHLLTHRPVDPGDLLLATAFVTFISYRFSQPVPGLGIAMPMIIPPLAAAFAALLLDGTGNAPLAYISGTLGVLLGADLLHLKDIRHLGTPLASIGGAGTFDGIFMTGIIAALLA